MYKQIIDKIKEYTNIAIYRHIKPDGDAVFSQFALATFINDNFKGKHIEVCGEEEFDLFPYSNTVSDKFLSNALVFVLDTSGEHRVDNASYKKGKCIIKIDHHPDFDNYGHINFIDDKCSSTSEVIAKILYSKDFKDYYRSIDTCKYLYAGIISDSNQFSTSNTTPNTLKYASLLAKEGGFDISALNNYLFSSDIDSFKSITEFRKLLKIDSGVGYIIANQATLNKLNMSPNDAKNTIDSEFGHINGLKIRAIFAYNQESGLFDASLRSLTKYNILDLSRKYGGGGHINACGVKNLTRKSMNTLISELIQIANNQ